MPRHVPKNRMNAKNPPRHSSPKPDAGKSAPAPEWRGPRWEQAPGKKSGKSGPGKFSPNKASSGKSSAPQPAAPAPRNTKGWTPKDSRIERPNLPKNMARSTTPRPGPGKFAPGRPAPGASWGHTAPPSRTRLEELLIGYGVQLPAAALEKVWQYHQILRRNNHDLDLTRLIGFETIVQRHYADCMTLHKMMKGNWPSPLVDIGTGAGFPGIMIKIASPATEVILSEPRNVRVDFLNNTIQELGLKGISVFGHKFTSKSFTTPVRGAITRAFEPISKTLPRLQNSLQVGGLAMFMKGPGVYEELSGPIPPGYKLVRDERYRIPKTTLDRAFVVFERTA